MSSNFGALTTLTSGAATLAAQSGQQFFYVQNTDTNPLTLTFKDTGGSTLGQIKLAPEGIAGPSGGYVDSISYPMFLDAATVVLAGTGSGTFTSGASKTAPTQIYQQDKVATRGR